MANKKIDKKHRVTYKKSGVSIENADKLIDKIKPVAKKTCDKNVIGNIGGFGAMYDISKLKYKNPVLVSGTDGVGTKLKIAIKMNKLDEIGIDLVAMCVNDIISQGAKPLFFLDYYATGKLNTNKTFQVIKGIAAGCKKSKMSLIGGETAEMPKLYKKNDFDIAGFCVGIAEKNKLLPNVNINKNDCIIGIKSSGLHSNGYSLINHMLDQRKITLNDKIGNSLLGKLLIKPTKIYTEILEIPSFKKIKAIANITGGGLTENIPRVLPKNKSALIDFKKIKLPKIFKHIQEKGNIDNKEILKVFNCGVGITLVINKKEAPGIIKELRKIKMNAFIIGNIIDTKDKSLVQYINI
ncbi:MAG: phosphoribosylformylglycinamidine cyclo-ligase [Gammaproteobacteria bacterium]|nr:phosphoribosylformylglycinamidine cyclo-ligase [Gammaproteobacteria bacterium]